MLPVIHLCAKVVAGLGKGALLGKVDNELAYRLVPVHPQDRVLQAVKWGDKVYVDPMLPFSLRSAPKVFNEIADTLNWILCQSGIAFAKRYLDDFVVIGVPGSDQCHRAMAILANDWGSRLPFTRRTATQPASTSWALILTRSEESSGSQQKRWNVCNPSWSNGETGRRAHAGKYNHW